MPLGLPFMQTKHYMLTPVVFMIYRSRRVEEKEKLGTLEAWHLQALFWSTFDELSCWEKCWQYAYFTRVFMGSISTLYYVYICLEISACYGVKWLTSCLLRTKFNHVIFALKSWCRWTLAMKLIACKPN